MLTTFTQATIAVLYDIASGNRQRSAKFPLMPEEFERLSNGLETHGLIRRLPEGEKSDLSSYALCRPLNQITLIEVLEAIGEPVHIDYPVPESDYFYHGHAAKKMGIVSQMARSLLSDVKLTDW